MSANLTQGYWAIVELMGHRRRAGFVQEVEQFGAKMLRIDIPAGEGSVTEFYGGSSIYALRPADEAVAREVAGQLSDPRPVAPVAYRLPAPEGPAPGALPDDDDFEEFEGGPF